MLEISLSVIFSIIVLLLLCATATKVFTHYFHPGEAERWWDDEEDEELETLPLQHPTNFTDYR